MKQVYNASFDIPSLNRFAVGFDRMFDELHRTAGTLNATNYPPYNIIKEVIDEHTTRFDIEVAVAGFAEDELDVEMLHNELTIRGERKITVAQDKRDIEFLHQGIAARNFERSFALADNVDIKGASVKNGILTVTLEHKVPEAEKPKKVAITFVK